VEKDLISRKGIAVVALILVGLAVLSRWFLAPSILHIPKDFSYQADVFSVDNFYDKEIKRFAGEAISNTTFFYEVLPAESQQDKLTILNRFVVETPTEEPIFEVSRKYRIDPISGRHVQQGAEKIREGFLFGPRSLDTLDFMYWHINYDIPLKMQFQTEEVIAGVKTYKYSCTFLADQTENLSHLDGVPETKGVELDVRLELWVDPLSGWLIKYEDFAKAWFYDIADHRRLYPWNKFHNEYKGNSIQRQVDYVKMIHLKWGVARVFFPLFCLVLLGLLVIAMQQRRYPLSRHKPIIASAALVIGGFCLSWYAFDRLVDTNRYKEYQRIEGQNLLAINAIKEEVRKIRNSLDAFRLQFKPLGRLEGLDRFSKWGAYSMSQLKSIEGVAYIPVVANHERQDFEAYWQDKGVEEFCFRSYADNGLKCMPEREEYFPLFFCFPEDQFQMVNGLDVGSNPTRRKTILKAKESFEMTASPPIVLRGSSPGLGFILYNPVTNNQGEVDRFFLAAIKTKRVINIALHTRNLLENCSLEIFEDNDQLIYSNLNGGEQKGEVFAEKSLPILNRLWKLKYYYPGIEPPIGAYLVLVFGGGLTLVLGMLIYKVLTDNQKKLISINRKLLNQHNELTRKNRELQQFAYIASHDLQEPLRTVTSFTALLSNSASDQLDGNAKKSILFITEAANRMSKLINGLLDFSRIDNEYEPEEVDCNAMVQEIVEGLVESENIEASQFRIGDLPVVSGVERNLKLLFHNLLSNAVKFRDPDRPLRVEVFAVQRNHEWKFSVKDNGIGIEKQHQSRIFKIFQRLHIRNLYDGAGIGLAHCQKIVEMHGGKLWVESELGKGSTFSFSLQNL